MASFSEKFEDVMMRIAEVVGDNIYLAAIKDAFTAYMPFTIIASMGSLCNTVICSTSTGLAIWFPALANLSPAFTAINYAGLSFITIPVTFIIGYNLAESKEGNKLATGTVSVVAYISMVEQEIIVDGVEDAVDGIATTTFGAQGLFVGMFTALVFGSLFIWLCTIDKIKIKMPAMVPAGITASFNVMIPVFITLICSALLGWAWESFTGSYINMWIYNVVQAPLEVLFNTQGGVIFMVLISQLFWCLGIHGGLIISPIRNPMFTASLAANTAAVAAGETPVDMFTMGFWNCFCVPGGAGFTFSLLIAIFLFSKREDYRSLAKIAIVPGVFGISEPVVFGIPLVLNPTFFIPFLLTGPICTAIATFATSIGFLPCNTVDVPFGLPLLVNAFIGHGWQGVVVQVIELAVGVVCYIPFVLISNKEWEKQVAEQNAAEEAAA